MSALVIVIATWLFACSSFQWTAEATYSSMYSQAARWEPRNVQWRFERPRSDIRIAVTAHFDMNGIRGNVTFSQDNIYDPITVVAEFDGLDQFEDEMWGWHVHDCPINFALLQEYPCSTASVGGHFDPDDRSSNENYTMNCMENSEECELGDLSGRFGRLLHDQSTYMYQFQERGLNLYDENTFVGRSIVIHRTHGFRWACANIEYDGHDRLDTFVASFPKDPKQQVNTIQGDIVMRLPSRRAAVSLSGVLHRVDDGPKDTSHKWSLRRGTCDSLSDTVLGQPTRPRPYYDMMCERHHRMCYIGDLSSKCGDLESDEDGRIKFFCTDIQLGSTNPNYFQNSENSPISVVIEEETASGGGVLACSCFERLRPKVAHAKIEQSFYEHVNGRPGHRYELVDFYVYQSDPHDPTYIRLHRNGLEQAEDINDDLYIQIRERPVGEDKNCSNLGPVFEPRPDFEALPEIDNVIQTGERDNLGELRNKIPLGNPPRRTSWLPLFGQNSIIGRSLVLHDGDGNVINCANIDQESPPPGMTRVSFSQYHKK